MWLGKSMLSSLVPLRIETCKHLLAWSVSDMSVRLPLDVGMVASSCSNTEGDWGEELECAWERQNA